MFVSISLFHFNYFKFQLKKKRKKNYFGGKYIFTTFVSDTIVGFKNWIRKKILWRIYFAATSLCSLYESAATASPASNPVILKSCVKSKSDREYSLNTWGPKMYLTFPTVSV